MRSMSAMTLRQIEVFRAVMLTGGVRSAADLLHVSQPAVSKVLAQMRRATGLELFASVKGRLLPTPEAQKLFDEVETLWRGVERVRDMSASLARPQSGYLRLAVSTSLAPYLVPHSVMRLLKSFPEVRVHTEILIGRAMTDSVLNGSVDIGAAVMPNEHPSIVPVNTFECGLACVVPSSHRFAQRAEVRPQDLRGERVIMSDASSQYGQILVRAIGKSLAHVLPIVEVRNSAMACCFVQAGAGIAIVDLTTVAGLTHTGLKVLKFRSKEKVEASLIHSNFRPLSTIGRAFCRAFDDVWQESMGPARRHTVRAHGGGALPPPGKLPDSIRRSTGA